MKIKILVLLLILSLLCGCGLAPSEESTSTDPIASEEIGSNPENSQDDEAPTVENNSENPTNEQPSNDGGSTSQSSSQQTSQGQEPQEVAIYEKYLAALSMYALVLEYPDFQLGTVYAASFVPMESKAQSKGIYVTFESGGMQLIAHLYPIEAERNESGARNVYSPEVGYAAFDIVSAVPDGLSTLSHDDYAAVMENISMPTVTMY